MDASYAPTALGRKVAEMNGIWNKLGPQAKLLFDRYPEVRSQLYPIPYTLYIVHCLVPSGLRGNPVHAQNS